MKKVILAIFAISCGILSLSASDAALFSYNRDRVNQELAGISNLEQYVQNNQGVNLSELPNEFAAITNQLDRSFNPAEDTDEISNPVFGIPSFCWGFCFSVPGIILVHVITGNYDESQKAFKGCLIEVILSVATYTVYIILVMVGVFSELAYY